MNINLLPVVNVACKVSIDIFCQVEHLSIHFYRINRRRPVVQSLQNVHAASTSQNQHLFHVRQMVGQGGRGLVEPGKGLSTGSRISYDAYAVTIRKYCKLR